jgi:hypothetical protein
LKHINNETELFEWLQSFVYPDLLIAKNPVSRWDCYSPKKKHRIELKCRHKHYPDLMIEKHKYDSVSAECAKHNDVPVYINSTPEGIYAFDMREHNGLWEIRAVPKTTQFASREFVSKEVGYFHIDEGHTLLKIC